MAKFKERSEALALRKDGYSIGDIAKKLEVSKSTISGWCKDISLSDKAILQIAKRSNAKSTHALLKYSELMRARRQSDTTKGMQQGIKRVGKMTTRDIFCIGVGLYWGEGYKKGSQEFGFTNSDPMMMRFYIKWLSVVFGIHKKDLILRISINSSHKTRVEEVERFWSKLLDIPRSQFTKTSLIKVKSKKVYDDTRHMGTLRIKVRKGTQLRREILGSISGIVQQT